MPQRIVPLPAFDRGTYTHEGFSRADSEAYFLRWNDKEVPQDQIRAFFAFDFSDLVLNPDDRITGVALSLDLPDRGFMSPNDRERVSIHATPTVLAEYILHGGDQPEVLFQILGAGDPVSDVFVHKSQEESSIVFPINDRGRQMISDSILAPDKRWILGARLLPWGPRVANRRLFMRTLNLPPEAARLDIEVDSL